MPVTVGPAWPPTQTSMQPFRCSRCETPVFFENDHCGHCGAALGFVPALGRMLAFDTTWQPYGGGPALQACANRAAHGICNWMLDADDPAPLCRSCRLTRVMPALSEGRNLDRWRAIEQAKRRLIFTLLGMGLAPQPKTGPDDADGLDFLLLETQAGQPPVRTGHDRGTITLDVAEADDEQRELQRVHFAEPTRTLLGHLRHEAAHYLQYRWLRGSAAAEACRASFGDERIDYATALARHYAEGPPADWPQRFVSAYASAHPWEDWAETCAHVLLVLDAVQTAAAWGLSLDGPADAAPTAQNLNDSPPVAELALRQWLPVAQFLNAMHRSLGQRDSYPFLLPPGVLDKMSTVQRLLKEASGA